MTFETGQSPGKVRGRPRRIWFIALSLIIALVAVGGSAVWHWRFDLAERVLVIAAGSVGIGVAAVSVDRLGSSGTELSGIEFGPSGSQRIAKVKIAWSLSELFDRRVRTIEVFGADLQAVMAPDGKFALEGLPPLKQAERPGGEIVFPKDLPFERIDVAQSRISVSLPDGNANIAVDGRLEGSPEALRGEIFARYAAETQRGRGTGTGSASIAWDGNSAPRGDIELVFDRLVTANATGTNIRLSGSTEGVPARLEELSIRAEASAEAIEIPQLTAHEIRLTADLSGGILDVRGAGMILDWAAELSARLEPFDLSRPAELVLRAKGEAGAVTGRMARVSAEGEVAIEIDAAIDNPAKLFAARDAVMQKPSLLADHADARVNIEADLNRFSLLEMLDTGAVTAKVSGHWSDGVLDVDVGEPSRVGGITLAPSLENSLANWMPKASPFDVAITAGMGSPPTGQLYWTDRQINMRMIGGVEVFLPEGAIELEADSKAAVTFGGAIERFGIAALDATFASVPTKFGVVSGDILATDISGEGETVSGAVTGEISVSAASVRRVSARQITANVDGEFRTAAGEVSLVLSPGGTVSARDVRLPGKQGLPGTTRFTFSNGTHNFTLNRRTGGFSADVRLDPGEAELYIAPSTFGIGHGAVAISGSWPGSLSFDAKRVSSSLDSKPILEVADLSLRADGKSADAVVAITVTDAKPVLSGLALPSFDGTGKIGRRGPSLDGEIELIAAGGQPRLRARARHNLKTGKGEGEILDARLRFAPGVLQPVDIDPAMKQTIENVFATISVQGPVTWGGGAVTPELTLKIEDLAGVAKNFELFDANVTVALTGAPALASPPGQKFTGRVRVGRLDPVPFDISFQLAPGQSGSGSQLVIEQITAQLAEGSLTTDRFTLTPPSIDTDVTIRVAGADLARVFEVIGVAGVGGTGRIGGEIPLQVRGSQVAVNGGRLANDGPGTVFYDISALPEPLTDRDDTVTLVLRALSNFAYDDLQVEMDKALDGPGKLGLRLTGANPDVLESHPFIFNITLESNFDRLAALVLEGLSTSQGLLRALALSAGGGAANVSLP